ncbi:MAG: hypothetical protein OXT72_03635 [Gammaproteobacteria bacterium]|nr:hypothetical protein [Gammaproteobacteria bacterium]MDE0248244.1 hypothetical protein [Gammaproteobacteria bacterium]
MNIAEFLKQNERRFESPWERRFARDVLARVPELNFERVSCQTAFRDAKGVPRRIDFTIEVNEDVRIAIEVDGWDKTGRGSGPTKDEWIADRERKLSIEAIGFDLIEFPNALVETKPENCARLIQLKISSHQRYAEVAEGAPEDAGIPPLSEAEREELAELNAERKAAIEALEIQLAAAHGGMKTVALAFATVLIVILIVGGSLLSRAQVDGSDPFCPNGLEWSEARSFVGQQGTFVGEVVGVTYVERSTSQPTFIHIGRPFPDPSRLTAVVWGRDRSRFPQRPEVAYSAGQELCITGEVSLFDGAVQIEVNSPTAVDVR